jgi:uncharacterized protein YggE
MKSLIAFCLAMFCVSPIPAQENRTIAVTGQGVATAVPDVAYIHLGVFTTADKVGKASSDNRIAMTKVFKSLKANGIEERDVCTNNYSVTPEYKVFNEKVGRLIEEGRKLVGYTVSNDIIVTVRNLDKLGDLIDALTADGHANQLTSVSFDVIDKEKALEKARELAVVNAISKAKTIAKAANVNLDKITTITENQHVPPAYSMSLRMEAAEGRTPLARGERQFKVTVNVTISLK